MVPPFGFDGFVAEGTISNVFVVKRGALKTPSLDCGILDSVTRRAVVETAGRSGFKVLETRLKAAELLAAEEVFLTSTTMEVMPVVKVDKKTVGNGTPGPVTRALHRAFREILGRELKIRV